MQVHNSLAHDLVPLHQYADIDELVRQLSEAAASKDAPAQDTATGSVKAAPVVSPPNDFYVGPDESDHSASGAVTQPDAGCLMIGHWECQICGARYQGPLPASCAACGADSHHLIHPAELRREMIAR